MGKVFQNSLKRIGFRPESSYQQLGRGIGLAALVGVVSGLGAVAFHAMCLLIEYFAMAQAVGYHGSGPAGEARWFDQWLPLVHVEFRWWMLLIVPTIGGLISGWLVFTFAPEAEGHGTDAAIEAFHHKRGMIRKRVPLVKMFSSAITISTGGSGGREGPIAQIGAGFGSYLATALKLSDAERRSLMAAGLGAGIGAIFHAPLAGAIFAAEVLYRDPDFEAENLIPSFIATTVAYSVFCLFSGFEPLFVIPELSFNNPLLLLPLGVLAVVMVTASFAYTQCFYGLHHLFAKLPIPKWTKPMLGAFLTGAVAIIIYFVAGMLGSSGNAATAQEDSLSVLSFGYGFLQKILNPAEHATVFMVGLLLLIGLGKILTTSLTIGSGGSGGVFGPSMVIGGALGAAVGLAVQRLFPGFGSAEEMVVIFAILGMASFFAAAANTPVSTLIMVSEMTAGYALLLPAMWVCALAYLLARGWTLYVKQEQSRRDSPAHRGDFIIDILRGLTVSDAMSKATTNFVSAPHGMPLGEMASLITDTNQAAFPVLDDEGQYTGLFGIDDIRHFIYEQGDLAMLAVAEDLAVEAAPLTLQMDLSEAMTQFATTPFAELPVVDEAQPQKVVGLLRRVDLISTYNTRLMAMRSTGEPTTTP